MRVVRLYHSGRDEAHRERERALVAAGVDLTLVVPTAWPDAGSQDVLSPEPFPVVELDVLRAGDVNRHRLARPEQLAELVARLRPDVVDLHEEPFSAVVHQVLAALPGAQPVVAYMSQNLDKRFPPPFAQRERAALDRLQGLYPCSHQAASVAVGKGFAGRVAVLPLAPPASVVPGDQQPPGEALRLLLVGRLVPEKGVLDAVEVLAGLGAGATLTLVGSGPEAGRAQQRATELGVAGALTLLPWLGAAALAQEYARAHVLLAPSRSTATWVEQFGRMVVEAHAAGAVVVGYRSGALPEVVGAGGVLVPEGDVAALGAAMASLRADPVRWSVLRRTGLEQAARITWRDVAAGHLALYADARDRPVPRTTGRTAARADHGAPATAAGETRPFALPVLRTGGRASRALARVLDAAAPTERPPAPARLRVVFLDHVAAQSGGELALVRLVAALTNIDAHVILGEDGPLRGLLEKVGAKVEVLPLSTRSREAHRDELGGIRAARSAVDLAAYTVRLALRLRRLRPHLVHTNSLKSGFYGSVAARLARVPVLWHVRDRITPDYLPPRVVRVTRLALQHLPQVVLANSEETLRSTEVMAGRSSVRAATVVHDPYQPTRAPADRATRTALVVGMVGRLAPWKGQEVFLWALTHPDLAVVRARIVGSAMFGEDDYAAGLHRLVEELGLADRVEIVGFVSDVESELAGLDVLVHASVLPEPWGQVVVEGMAAGLPVIATDAGGPAEIITDGVDGLLVAPGDVDALASAIARLAEQRTLRDDLGHAAVRRAAVFTPGRAAPELELLYRSAARFR
ncbi:glycosyltransferase [Rhodococcus antarcticus]|uniref:Glycosyltransferase n=1 Tax=Rhodococcus antarcticus TaxID=2987751 RepID=A0ABY6NZZ2_9NOCA|nr:glycosyltransferase [Rhodococcus antarcticus]UZJ24974.1 glycosyltransferase [Rhodococcus antarcticus]